MEAKVYFRSPVRMMLLTAGPDGLPRDGPVIDRWMNMRAGWCRPKASLDEDEARSAGDKAGGGGRTCSVPNLYSFSVASDLSA